MTVPKYAAKLAFLGIVFFVISCGSTRVPVEVVKPARINMHGIHSVAVTDFEGPGESGKLVTSILNTKLLNSNFYEVLERQKLQDIMQEYKLSMSGLVDPSHAKEVGKMLGVDGIITGEVTAYSVEDERGRERVKERVWTGKYEKDAKGNFIYEKGITGKKHKKKQYKEQFVTRYYKLRRGTVTVTFRVVDVNTGRILAARTYTRSYSSRKVPEGQESRLKSRDAILTDLTTQVVDEFVKDIAPHKIVMKRVILGGPGPIDAGKKLAKNGLWPEATKAWEDAVRQFPDKSEAFYDLGLAYEVQGRLNDAEKLYQKALQIKPDKLYMKALAEVRKAKEERQILEQQLKERQTK